MRVPQNNIYCSSRFLRSIQRGCLAFATVICAAGSIYAATAISTLPADTSNTADGQVFASDVRYRAFSFRVGSTPQDIIDVQFFASADGADDTHALTLNADNSNEPGSVISTFNGVTPTFSSNTAFTLRTATCLTGCTASNFAANTKYWLVFQGGSVRKNINIDTTSPTAVSSLGWGTTVGMGASDDITGALSNDSGSS